MNIIMDNDLSIKNEKVKNFKTFCVIGDPISHSLSPLIHNASFAALKLNYSYIAFRVPSSELEVSVNSLKTINIAGFNVTIPHKVDIINYVDELSEDAKTAGAINTVKNENGKFIGFNTDISGLIAPLEERKFSFKDSEILILGAGGSCRAALVGLSKKGINKITIVNRDQKKINEVVLLGKNLGLNCIPLDYNDQNILNKVSEKSNLIINTTSIGLNNETNPLKSDFMNKDAIVFDIVYRPLYTDLLNKAKSAGCHIVFGYEMLLHQAAKSFEIWTGLPAPLETMKKSLFGIFGEPK